MQKKTVSARQLTSTQIIPSREDVEKTREMQATVDIP